ncbi:MAG TPA: bifunctional UDP-N-acetylglucosamine diphosphorylase/glucosamine-1-phosphate N-acetyltransferase GlmU [Bryobacteraceae bacterium]|nr:bifunctional UDP-N-acetylglucosamine diphosphorylase/glucosamine-1-phosphate N-acetyltransferase GlmU [Bryobacteraceae bacterium]
MTPSTNVIILAAGLGTRMKSRRAKVLHRAGGLTLIEHVVRTATAIAAPENITVVVGHQAEGVKKALAHTPVRFAMQTEQKGTGHAVMMCADALHVKPGYTVIIYGDGPLLSASTLARLVETEQRSGTAATLITTVLEDPRGYGRVVLDDRGSVLSIVEEKAATDEQRKIKLVNSGIYCFRTDLLCKHIAEIEPNPVSGEYYLTDMPEILAHHGQTVGAMEVADSTELLGINTRAELAEVDALLRSRKTRELMLAGVTIEKPETVTVDADVSAGMDSEIGAFAQLLGNTRIGHNCRIGACSIVQNSMLEDGVVIEPFTVISDSRVAAAAHIGPFARLRMGNEVGPSAHIGNFVELKNTRFGAGAKANHLAYLGDSEIGARVNVGAGTITCNYDGVRKHRTQIGEGAFIGSNSTLVAPIEIGSESYVGAGSVITDPVPPGALALGRGRQVVKEGWVEKGKKQ